MMAIANLQYAWTLFTIPLTRELHTSLAAVQVTFTLFVLAHLASMFGSWVPILWAAVVCDLTAMALALTVLKPLVAAGIRRDTRLRTLSTT
jgi:hypothetical protein